MTNKKSKRLVMLYRLLLLMFILPSFAMAATYGTAHIEKKGASYDVSVDYPQFKDPNAQELKANKAIVRFVHSIFDKDLKAFIKDSKSDQKEMDSSLGDSVDISFKVIRFDDRFLSIKFEKESYGAGAAHPDHETICFNYDIKKMRLLKLEDLFNSGTNYLNQLSQYCSKYLYDKFKSSGYVDKESIKDGAGPKKKNFKAFCLDKTELIVIFQEYQVADYAEGSSEVKIPFKDLTGFSYEDIR